ncbi:S1-like domain-containing RNA-binding protein [Microbacterium sp. APC 3898]|uniref:S1-like domain-containing RNA-binding protein n=1 Tax=Planococcus notacanthi TaxID=3035188 RepID=A0ABT7ZM57_9BACL|nr:MULTISPECIES: S1-like domain-containing RNA-binding protein [Terrabacteria group]MDN3428245.1 S1-like domain-containing RNA-binding protein [Planococcus sp. APC 4016]MDN3439436.1 S1-like domain-containing RNA-binding protein [Planococcus sp. APC 3900]MDN3498217.1 S1-like domain-containing RNA-binding protein [Microbacterium sp. APC 3898]
MALHPGLKATLQVKDRSTSQWILSDGSGDEVMMNASEIEEGQEIGEEIEVFLYRNRQGGVSATPMIPHILPSEYGWAKVLKVSPREGAVVDIGTTREVYLLPADLPQIMELWPKQGDHIFMTLRTDRHGDLYGRLATEEKVLELMQPAPETAFNQNLQARAYRLLPVGTFMLSVPEMYRIFIHETERHEEPRLGEEKTVRIIDVKDDGTLNGSLLPRKQERLADDAEEIMRYLEESGGKMPFTDKSSPDEIQEIFGMSKAAFKRALGKLYKNRQIIQEDGWTKSTK